jgi:hypothetical protein
MWCPAIGALLVRLVKRGWRRVYRLTATAVGSDAIRGLWKIPIIGFAGCNTGTLWYGLAVVSANMIGRDEVASPET